ncbi:YjbH domain-containing protein [Escherichia coli]
MSTDVRSAKCSTTVLPATCSAAWKTRRLATAAPKLEDEGNNYPAGFCREAGREKSFNVGAIYRVTDWAERCLSYERGNTFNVWRHAAHQLGRSPPCSTIMPARTINRSQHPAILQHSVVANQLTLLNTMPDLPINIFRRKAIRCTSR